MAKQQHVHDNLPAVFPDHESAEAAAEELRRIGVADDHLGVAVHEPGQTVVFEEDADHETGLAVERGIAVGVPLGFLAGMAIVALAVPGVGTVGVGGLLAGGAAGGIGGAFAGGFGGVLAKVPLLDEEEHMADIPLGEGEVLLVVRAHGRAEEVREVLERHGGRCVPERCE
ncbi:MAG: hypothetical protein M5U14_00105 [Acidimicrobiia bacterium]|nr:hypothetical protein [Acidimicrobiia bacterium]